MKENKYDDAAFFEEYSRMDRSVKGLEGAGEWHTLKALLPAFEGKRVLDLGCGFGWHCRYAAEHGATKVVGVDISAKMLEHARQVNALPQIEYIQMPVEDIDLQSGSFDVVLSSLTFHYIESFDNVVRKIHDCLAPNGSFVFSAEHPVFTAYGNQDWHYDTDGSKMHWPVDNYFSEGRREAIFLDEKVTKYHRTLTTYINGLLRNGFRIRHVVEAQPDSDMVESIPGMADELRRPMMILISATKE